MNKLISFPLKMAAVIMKITVSVTDFNLFAPFINKKLIIITESWLLRSYVPLMKIFFFEIGLFYRYNKIHFNHIGNRSYERLKGFLQSLFNIISETT